MRTRLALSLIVSCAVMAGCSSLHPYNKESDSAVTGAKADYDAAKLGERLQGQRAMLVKLEEREVAAARRMTVALRDQDLLALLADTELSAVVKDTSINTSLKSVGEIARIVNGSIGA